MSGSAITPATVRRMNAALAALGALILAACGGVASAAGQTGALTGSWKLVKVVHNPNSPVFTAVTATSATSAWAFQTNVGVGLRTIAWRLSGSTWSVKPFPGQPNENVNGATASSASNVWAWTSNNRILRYDGTSWSVIKTFTQGVGSAVVLSDHDAWVFGQPFVPGNGLGTWHYTNGTWTKVRSGRGLFGGSALSANSIWAYGSKIVAHWNGSTWHGTSVARLLPRSTQLCFSHLTAIYAASARNVWAAGAGGCQDELGPFVLLHYNGATWRRVVLDIHLGQPTAVIADGRGGIWLPSQNGVGGTSTIEHYAHGHLTSAHLPIHAQRLLLDGAAIGPHTTAALAVGETFSATSTAAVILRFER